MSSRQRLKSLENRQQQIESQIAELEKLSNKCTQDIKAESNAAKRIQLNTQIDNYSTEIDELYDKLDEIEKKIRKLKASQPEPIQNPHEDNHKNQQELEINKALCYIDFHQALETFKNIQSQFNTNGDAALFLIEEILIKRGDLYLQRLKDYLTSNNHYGYQQKYPPCHVEYTAGNLDEVIQKIGNHFGIEKPENNLNEHIKLVVEKISNSLQNYSILFIEINCYINDASEIDLLIPPFINDFWKPLISKINKVTETEDYEGIKVVSVISSKLPINRRLSQDNLSCYCNHDLQPFSRDKLVRINLEKWSEYDIGEWLIKYVNPTLRRPEKERIANRIYRETQGLPNSVCYALKQQWETLINSPTSC